MSVHRHRKVLTRNEQPFSYRFFRNNPEFIKWIINILTGSLPVYVFLLQAIIIIIFMASKYRINPDGDFESNPIDVLQSMKPTSNRLIIIITPTYKRLTRLPDLIRMSYTLMHIKNIIWILIEDGFNTSTQVERLLNRSGIVYVYYATPRDKSLPRRGWTSRNSALEIVRHKFYNFGSNAVVYFADDDNTYDIRLFDDYIRNVDKVGVWAVGLAAQSPLEAPKVENGTVIGWNTPYAPNRKWGIDMAGFAINLQLILNHKNANFKSCKNVSPEPCLLDRLNITMKDLVPFGHNSVPREILVYHTKTVNIKTNGTSDYGYVVEF